METLNAIYKNGVLVLIDKVDPEKLKSKIINIRIVDEELLKQSQGDKLKNIYKYLHKSKPFSEIKDVINWQKHIRIDRELFN